MELLGKLSLFESLSTPPPRASSEKGHRTRDYNLVELRVYEGDRETPTPTLIWFSPPINRTNPITYQLTQYSAPVHLGGFAHTRPPRRPQHACKPPGAQSFRTRHASRLATPSLALIIPEVPLLMKRKRNEWGGQHLKVRGTCQSTITFDGVRHGVYDDFKNIWSDRIASWKSWNAFHRPRRKAKPMFQGDPV